MSGAHVVPALGPPWMNSAGGPSPTSCTRISTFQGASRTRRSIGSLPTDSQSTRSASRYRASFMWAGSRQRHVVVEKRPRVIDVEPVVAAGAAAELARPEAGVGDKEPFEQHGPARVTEAAPALGLGVVCVLLELEYL